MYNVLIENIDTQSINNITVGLATNKYIYIYDGNYTTTKYKCILVL